MGVIKITDCNGKEFNVDVNKMIYHINDDLSSESNSLFVTNTESTETNPSVPVTITDSDGGTFSLTDSENSLDDIVDIDVYIEASHSDTKINNAYYTSSSMLRDFSTYTHPFKKPLLRHHNSYSGEPIGRIISSDCIDSALIDGTKAIDVIAKVSDKDAITKFLDGRYSTVSIGASANTITCNHCGKHILKDGKFNFCGHWRGETYDGKLCTWNCEDLEYSELSVVNSPADKYAQVYRIVVNRKSNNKQQNSQEDSDENISISKASSHSVADSIINFANETTQTTEIKQQENDDTKTEQTTELNDDQKEYFTSKIENLSEMINTLQNQLDDLTNKNKELENTANVLKIDNDLLSTKLEKVTDMYIDDLILINNLDRKQELFNKENSFKELKENLLNFVSKYNEAEKGNNQNKSDLNNNSTNTENNNTIVKVKSNPNPGLFNNNDNYTELEDKKSKEDIKIIEINNSFESLVSALVK